MELEEKIMLNEEEKFIQTEYKTQGPHHETDIYKYNIVSSNGEIVGYVKYTDHTS
ncbi:hypothetical protein HXZ79_05425 [Acinetobacter indicus]|uniref:hypothetical protein n=1 Tax=Acinetobacter indicus TaxID=756892 RepID=UPI002577A0A0|nr:hypothetical protein [Acinetobacter indicus]MDM1310707.1 hypothetical protein [Acinetobacter indicus]